jgi:hypothetical protein
MSNKTTAGDATLKGVKLSEMFLHIKGYRVPVINVSKSEGEFLSKNVRGIPTIFWRSGDDVILWPTPSDEYELEIVE